MKTGAEIRLPSLYRHKWDSWFSPDFLIWTLSLEKTVMGERIFFNGSGTDYCLLIYSGKSHQGKPLGPEGEHELKRKNPDL